MNELELKKKLYSKMSKEFDEFKANLRDYSFEKILDMSYEYTIKNELLNMFYFENDYDIDQIKALYICDNPLQELYDGYFDSDVGIHNILENCVDNTIDDLMEEYDTDKAINYLIEVTKKKKAQLLER